MQITFHTHDGATHVVNAELGKSVMEIARENNLNGIVAECGGSCACATCHVYVDADWVERLRPKDDMEGDMLDFAWEPRETSRLSCQIVLIEELDGLSVQIPEQQA